MTKDDANINGYSMDYKKKKNFHLKEFVTIYEMILLFSISTID